MGTAIALRTATCAGRVGTRRPGTHTATVTVATLGVIALLLVTARPAAAAQIVPMVRLGDVDVPDNEYVFRFDYFNNGSPVIIPAGNPQNFVEPGAIFQGQPQVFSAGLLTNDFSVNVIVDDVEAFVSWHIDGSEARFNVAGDFFYDFADGLPVPISESGGLGGQHSHASPGAGFQITGLSDVGGGAEVSVGSDGRLIQNGGTFQVNSLSIEPGGQWIYLGGSTDLGAGLTNSGSAALFNVTVNQPVHNAAGSTTDIVGDVTFAALVSGPGAFFGSGTTHFDGGYSPGASPAVVPFEGRVGFGSANLFEIELGGLAMGQFDRLEIASDATLDGTLEVSLLAPFNLSFGDTFEILNVAGALGGQFTGLAEGAMIDVGQGPRLKLSYAGGDGNDVVLTAVPEPGVGFLAAMSWASLIRLRRRQISPQRKQGTMQPIPSLARRVCVSAI